MKIALAALSLLFVGLLADSAIAQAAPSHAPVITRPVAAHFPSETFTLFWRPNTLNTAPVTEYRIYREQNAGGDRNFTAHPTRCNSINFSVRLTAHTFTVSLSHPQVHQYTVNPRGTAQPGITHGNCYRWKIAAANANGAGPAATTEPILARGFVINSTVHAYDNTRNNNAEPCPQDTSRPYAYNDNGWGTTCYANQFIDRAERCNALRQEGAQNVVAASYRDSDDLCVVRVPGDIEDRTFCTSRGFTDEGWHSSREHCRIPQQCQNLQEYNLNHRECLCRGWATPASSGSGCECTVTGANNDCECPTGQTYSPETNSCRVCPVGQTQVTGVNSAGCFPSVIVEILDDCEDAGWRGREAALFFPNIGELGCGIPSSIEAPVGGTTQSAGGCALVDVPSLSPVPQCVDMYGDPPVFPKAADHPGVKKDGTGGGELFIANCDRDGTVPGGYPPDANINGETECTCGPGYTGTYPNCEEVQTPDAICVNQGWTYDSASAKCQIPLTSAGTDYDGCFVSGETAPQCDDVFGESFAFPATVVGVALRLYNGFHSEAASSANPAYITVAAAIWRDAVVARHTGKPNYAAAPAANLADNNQPQNDLIVQQLSRYFKDNGIPFDDNRENPGVYPNEISVAFAAIPVRGRFVFNCGEGATPATANTISATECQCGGANPLLSGGVCVAECPADALSLSGESFPPRPRTNARPPGGTTPAARIALFPLRTFNPTPAR